MSYLRAKSLQMTYPDPLKVPKSIDPKARALPERRPDLRVDPGAGRDDAD